MGLTRTFMMLIIMMAGTYIIFEKSKAAAIKRHCPEKFIVMKMCAIV
jgi:hypothetical protein